MIAGDNVRVTGGEFKDKTGKLVVEWIVKGEAEPEKADSHDAGRWIVEFEDGDHHWIDESLLEVIEPE